MSQHKPDNGGTTDRSQRRREQTARTLLDAARRVLAAKGYHGTKIVDIARAASVGVGTFYLYYPTKEALFLELVEDTVARLKTELDGVRSSVADPIEQSRVRTLTFFRFAQENRELFRIVFGHGASFHDVVRRCQEGFIRDLHEIIAAGMKAGALREGDAMIWAQAFIGMSLQVVSWWIEQENVPIEDVAASLSDLALHGMVAPGAERTPDAAIRASTAR
ncbi:TetR/AcrR family transcriptional regulator [bacterium]|nr:TetR/AcrR family transcriptional regulator [bacterium]